MFSSTIIPTIGRDSLTNAVESVLEQSLSGDSFQVIVVNDSGSALPEASWQASSRVTILETPRLERSAARNAGAAASQGRYLHFLDDDDMLLPEAMEALRKTTSESGAEWVYGRTQLIDRQRRPLLVLDHQLEGNIFVQAMAGEWIPLQSSLIQAQAFNQCGGFNPRLAGPEDIDLQRRIAAFGRFAGTQAITANVAMGHLGGSTNWTEHAPASQQAREALLEQAGCWRRLRSSAAEASRHRSYWQGRIARLYLTSLVWNLRHRRLRVALWRGAYGAASLLLAGQHLLRWETWQAVTQPYQSFSFSAGKTGPSRSSL